MDERRFAKLLWGIKAALVAVLLYCGFKAISSRVGVDQVLEPHAVSGGERPARPAERVEDDRQVDYSAILRRNLFADDPAVGQSRPPVVETMPSAEELGLRLIGAIAGGPVASRAIIQNTKEKTTNPYRIGDTVASATVESIRPDVVVLRYQGEQFALRLNAAAGEDTGKTVAKRQERPKQVARPVVQTAQPSTRAARVTEAFRQIQIEPHVVNRRTQGLRVTGLDKVPLAGVLGLRDGDVIQRINGQQLTSKQKAFQVMMKAKAQPKIDIQLMRDGRSKDLSFNM